MKRFNIRLISLVLIVFILLFTQAQVAAEYLQHTWAAFTNPIATSRGPEADPYLRHEPGGYDYELEPPPEEIP